MCCRYANSSASLGYDDLPLIWKLVLIKLTYNTEIITAMTKAEVKVNISGSFSPLFPARPLKVLYLLHGLQNEGWHLSHTNYHFLLGEFGHHLVPKVAFALQCAN